MEELKKSEVSRGDIIYFNLNGEGSVQSGIRPCCVISNNLCNKFSPVVTVVPLTSKICKKNIPTHVKLNKKQTKLKTDSVALVEQLITVNKTQICEGGWISNVGEESIKKIEKAALIQLGMHNIFNLHKEEAAIDLDVIRNFKEDITELENCYIKTKTEFARKELVSMLKEFKLYLLENNAQVDKYLHTKYIKFLDVNNKMENKGIKLAY